MPGSLTAVPTAFNSRRDEGGFLQSGLFLFLLLFQVSDKMGMMTEEKSEVLKPENFEVTLPNSEDTLTVKAKIPAD
ncbi:MAG: hypothetical protein QHH14_14440 [Clostridiales bacterium]|nr:hypothetical protein [Clostridiales bacterium]